jgi:dihydrofolate synthase/folylpolyglutamate synthase
VNAEEALAYIAARGRFGELGLSRIRRLLGALGHPEERYRVAHIAGTNGKGSTAAFLAAMLQAAGERVGLYTSPHLVDPLERIQVDGVPITGAELAHLLAMCLDGPLIGEEDPATEFELWTALAFLAFAERGVTTAVVEVGLGGRFDATNAIARPQVTAITSIGFDHMDRLGDTLGAIAREKAGILKPGVPAVVGALPEEALAVVLEAAAGRGVPLLRQGVDFEATGGFREGAWWLSYRRGGTVREYRLGLLGPHQVGNAALARAMAEVLGVPEEAAAQGLAQAHWPGRFDLRRGGRLILDGAHNPDGMAVLAETLAAMYPGERLRVVFGCLRDREPEELLRPLAPHIGQLLLVDAPSERGFRAEELEARLGRGTATTLAAALAEGAEVRTLVTGSLYLVGEALALLQA